MQYFTSTRAEEDVGHVGEVLVLSFSADGCENPLNVDGYRM